MASGHKATFHPIAASNRRWSAIWQNRSQWWYFCLGFCSGIGNRGSLEQVQVLSFYSCSRALRWNVGHWKIAVHSSWKCYTYKLPDCSSSSSSSNACSIYYCCSDVLNNLYSQCSSMGIKRLLEVNDVSYTLKLPQIWYLIFIFPFINKCAKKCLPSRLFGSLHEEAYSILHLQVALSPLVAQYRPPILPRHKLWPPANSKIS